MINEKVDLFSLGIILYQILYDVEPFKDENKLNQMKAEYKLTDEMIRKYNSNIIELMRNLLSQNPKDRFSAEEVVDFIEKNWDQVNLDSVSKVITLHPKENQILRKMTEAAAIVFKRHSTQ